MSQMEQLYLDDLHVGRIRASSPCAAPCSSRTGSPSTRRGPPGTIRSAYESRNRDENPEALVGLRVSTGSRRTGCGLGEPSLAASSISRAISGSEKMCGLLRRRRAASNRRGGTSVRGRLY